MLVSSIAKSLNTWLHVHHANIVQMVKTCYKIKSILENQKAVFMGFYCIKATLDDHQKHQSALIALLLQSQSGAVAR